MLLTPWPNDVAIAGMRKHAFGVVCVSVAVLALAGCAGGAQQSVDSPRREAGHNTRDTESKLTVWNRTNENGKTGRTFEVWTTADGTDGGRQTFRQTVKPGESWVGAGDNLPPGRDVLAVMYEGDKYLGSVGVSRDPLADPNNQRAEISRTYSRVGYGDTITNRVDTTDTSWGDRKRGLKWHHSKDSSPPSFSVDIFE